MSLLNIDSPDYIHSISPKEREMLAKEIRQFLLANVSKTGGHLASNLGIVELTIALHAVFDIAIDHIVFDIGHQSYVHKILCGNTEQFGTLRQFQGLSGYQKRFENKYDVLEARHAGSALSLASGYRDSLAGKEGEMIVVLGDNALTNGATFEALQFIAKRKQNIIVVLNDNEESARSNAMLSQLIDRVRVTKTYLNTKREVSSLLNDSAVGKPFYIGLKKVHDTLKDTMLHSSLFNELGFEYLGPINGHNFDELIPYLTKSKASKIPIVVHVRTQSGKNDADISVPFFKSLTEYPANYCNYSTRTAYVLANLAKKNDKISVSSHLNEYFSDFDIFRKEYPDRYYSYKMDFSHMLMFNSGLAIGGGRPFIEISSAMVQRVYDQINHDIARLDLPVVLGIKETGLMGEEGTSFHGIFDYSLLKSLPNCVIAMGKDLHEHQQLLCTAFKQYHPFILRYTAAVEETPETIDLTSIALGSWEILYKPEQSSGIIISYGPDVKKIYNKVIINDFPVTIVNARYLKPIDEKLILSLIKEDIPILVYETEIYTGNLGSTILEFFNEQDIAKHIYRTGIHDHFVEHGSINVLRKNEKLDINTVLEDFMIVVGKHNAS